MKLEQAIGFIDGDTSHFDPALLERDVDTFVIDSREVKAGDLFFALSQPEYANNGFNGDFDDATAFAAGAFEAGALACVVRRDRFEGRLEQLEKYKDRLIFVDDVIVALQHAAHGVYLEWNKPVVAITGSAGKTTAKELTAHVLASGGRKVLRNIKNYNNGLGHPLTVLNLASDGTYDVAVLEMGMSTPMHEITRLCEITPPDVSVVLNVLPVHVEHLGSIENVAAAKAEIVDGMKPHGVAVLNADDPRVAAMASKANGTVLTYGIDSPADVTALDIDVHGFGSTDFVLDVKGEQVPVKFPLNGNHNIMNALAAAAVAHTFAMPAKDIAASLSTVAAPPQRGEVLRFAKGFTVINDSYNSNPDALISMVETLVSGAPAGSRKVVVAGEMLELGPEGAAIHASVGKKIGELGVDVLVAVRGLASEMIVPAVQSGIETALFAANSDIAADIVVAEARSGDVILVKGSRGVRTEKVIEKLLENFELEEARAAA